MYGSKYCFLKSLNPPSANQVLPCLPSLSLFGIADSCEMNLTLTIESGCFLTNSVTCTKASFSCSLITFPDLVSLLSNVYHPAG